MNTNPRTESRLTTGMLALAWWPLALSWLLMGIELPLISAVVARLPDETIQLAAFGGVVFPLALLVEGPVIMLLAASTTLSTNLAAFKALRRFATLLSFWLTLLHVILACTPVYYWLIVPLLDVPADVIDPARRGFMLMIPWTWSIADRRFHQGLLIRFDQQNAVVIGTGIRLATTVSSLLVGWLVIEGEGVLVAASALTLGTLTEALYARIRSRPIIKGALTTSPIDDRVLTGRALLRFYVPLALTPVLVIAMQPIGSAGIDRMPNAVISLAVWAPLNGLVFMCRSVGVAYNEVVISNCGSMQRLGLLRRFAWLTGTIVTLLLAIVSFTPLAEHWFGSVMGLDPELVELGASALWIAAPIPLLTFLQSLYQGLLVHAHITRAVTESVVVFLVVTISILVVGVLMQPSSGIYAVLSALLAGNVTQTLWLWHRCRRTIFIASN
ncbi:MAG: hypothetical protein CMJ36_00130 [Phycisphaerae bacterium]|nr:hypothetical protein [Phycisphaerae bacterium]